MKKISILCLTMLSFIFCQSQIRYLKGRLQGSQETPQLDVPGSGVVIAKYDMSTKTLKLYGDYADLTAPVSGSHIHHGAPGEAGPIVVDIIYTDQTIFVKYILTHPEYDKEKWKNDPYF